MRVRKTQGAIMAQASLLFLFTLTLWQTGCSHRPEPPEKITIGTNLVGMNGLLYIAKNQQYDQENARS